MIWGVGVGVLEERGSAAICSAAWVRECVCACVPLTQFAVRLITARINKKMHLQLYFHAALCQMFSI